MLNSTEGMQAARPGKELYGQLRNRLGRTLPKAHRIPLSIISAAAACLLILLGLNITLVRNYAKAETEELQEENGTVQDIIDYYELGSNNVGL